MALTHRVEGTPEVHNHTHCAFVLWFLKLSIKSEEKPRGILQDPGPALLKAVVVGEMAQGMKECCAKTQGPEFRSRNPRRKAGVAAHACCPHCGSTDGSQTGFRFSEQPCLERIRQRVIEQITQRPPLVSVGTHTCAYTLHVYRTYICHIHTLICIHTYI